jgi:potassium-transporting ATPase KdpC subunit
MRHCYTNMKTLRTSLALFACLSILTGIAYPLFTTMVAQLLFPRQANGSLVRQNQTVVGSALIGQQFQDAGHFWGRPSATADAPYNAAASGGSNLGPSASSLHDSILARTARLRIADSLFTGPVPIDLVTSSGSGLDPDISVAAALVQAPRIAHARTMSAEKVIQLIRIQTRDRQWLVLGEPRVNVLLLNIALDSIAVSTRETK